MSGGRQPVAGPGQVPHAVAGQGVQLVAAHGDGLVQGLHGGPAGGARVEAAGELCVRPRPRPQTVPVPLAGAASPDLQLETKHKTVQNDPGSVQIV